MIEKKKPSIAKKTQQSQAQSESYSELLGSIVSLIQAQQETNKLLIEGQNKILDSITTKQEVVVPEREIEVPVFTDEVTYQVFGEIATKFEYEMSIEIFGEYKTKEEAERMLEVVKDKYLGKPYDKYATPIYFKYFNIKENIIKVING